MNPPGHLDGNLRWDLAKALCDDDPDEVKRTIHFTLNIASTVYPYQNLIDERSEPMKDEELRLQMASREPTKLEQIDYTIAEALLEYPGSSSSESSGEFIYYDCYGML